MPTWALALAYWLHLMATVIWVGGLSLMVMLIWPAALKRPQPETARWLVELQRRFNPWAWLSLATLTVTGLMQMTANENYHGLLTIDSAWASAMLLKHVAVLGMMGCGVWLQWGLHPELARLVLKIEHGQPAPELEPLRRRELNLLRLNLACAVLVLLFTAMATAL